MNGVLVFRPSICAGEREQMFLISPSGFQCPLPSPNSAAGSISVPTLRPSPTQCLSQHRPWWEECQKLRGSPCSSLLSGWLWLPIGFRKQPWPQIQTWWRFHAVPPLWFCLLHCLLLCSLLRWAPHYPAILGSYQFSFPRLDGSWLQMASWPLPTGSPCPSHETLPWLPVLFCNQDGCSFGNVDIQFSPWGWASYPYFTCGFYSDPSEPISCIGIHS